MKKLLLLAIMWSGITVFAAKYSWEINTGGKAVFQKNEKITFSCQLLKDGKAAIGDQVSFEIRGDNNIHKKGNFKISETPWTYETSLDFSGWLFIRFSAFDSEGKKILHDVKSRGKMVTRQLSDGIGVLVEPEKLQPPMPEPADFDAFWAAKRAELDKVPVKAVRVPFSPKGGKYFNCWDIKVDCAGGRPVSGYLCIPKGAKPKSLPVAVRFHGAGVRSANAVLYYRGLIVLDVNAHGIANGRDAAFYSDLQKKDLNNYHARNKLDRNKGYFVGMYMRVMRALDYVKTLPEWDGKTLIVFGGSQGGAQSLAAAALDKDVTHCIAGVPALCDHGGVLAERSAGWPQFVSWFRIGKMTAEDRAVLPEVAYVDCAYMARRIKAKTYIGTGFMDYVCAPTSVFAAYNNIPAGTEKDIVTTPDKAHNAPNTKGMKWLADFSAQVFKSQGKE